MARGRVIQWKNGTGHIRDDADGVEYFFRDRSLIGLRPNDVHVGLEVEYTRGRNNRGPTASDVRRAGGTTTPPPPAATPVGRSGAPQPPPVGGVRRIEVQRMSDEDILRCIPVPASLRQLLDTVKDAGRHPGLMLDRFLQPCPKQEQQRDVLDKVVTLSGDPGLLKEQLARRAATLTQLGAGVWSRTTGGPLTLHLARASALENAGLCLHPIYGFAYLPGTGLKGLARAYAETVWLAAQPDPVAAWQRIEQVFGWVSESDRGKTGTSGDVPDHGNHDKSAAGTIVFHDAWPETWPGLLVDIVNNHHPEYYQGDEPPGDWQSPNPVYFLAVKPGTAFSFALSKRRGDVKDDLLALARQWLNGGLTALGCGAKTAAGYGAFRPEANTTPVQSPRVLEAHYTLELVTPAYLAGASQRAEDCDLRSATLRGLLRWWWRTMHAGYVDVATLRSLEAAVWGDTDAGGAVQVRVTKISGQAPVESPYKSINPNGQLRFNPAFAHQHHLQVPYNRTAGLAYAGYGMDEMVNPGPGQPPQRRRRWCALPGTRWRVELRVRPGRFVRRDDNGKVLSEVPVAPQVLLDQARTALWWFCSLGGAGSKARKGFGSFALPAELGSFEGGRFITHGTALRNACGLPEGAFDSTRAESPSLKLMREVSRGVVGESGPAWPVFPLTWDDPWRAVDLIGRAMQECAQSDPLTGHGKHCPAKRGLGLPRQIHGPRRMPMPHQHPPNHRPPEHLQSVRGDRHSSPVLFHVGRQPNGRLEVHVAAFPTADLREPGTQALPGLQAHTRFLIDYLRHLAPAITEAMR